MMVEKIGPVAGEVINQLQQQEITLKSELENCRETNRRLNRRCQLYASGMEEKIEKGKAEYRNLGRIFANATAEAYAVKLDAIANLCREFDSNSLSSEILAIVERSFSDDLELP